MKYMIKSVVNRYWDRETENVVPLSRALSYANHWCKAPDTPATLDGFLRH